MLVVPSGTSGEGVSSTVIVGRCNHGRNTDAREAWLELEGMYGERAPGEQSVHLLALERRLQYLQRNSAEDFADLVVKLDTILGEFEALANVKAEKTKRASLLRGIKEALPHVFIQLTTQACMTYNELELAVMASTCLTLLETE